MQVTPESAMRAWFEDLWNTGDESTIDRMLPAHGVVHGLPRIDFLGFTLARFVDGQLVEGWNSFNFLAMYEQIGVRLNMPSAG